MGPAPRHLSRLPFLPNPTPRVAALLGGGRERTPFPLFSLLFSKCNKRPRKREGGREREEGREKEGGREGKGRGEEGRRRERKRESMFAISARTILIGSPPPDRSQSAREPGHLRPLRQDGQDRQAERMQGPRELGAI